MEIECEPVRLPRQTAGRQACPEALLLCGTRRSLGMGWGRLRLPDRLWVGQFTALLWVPLLYYAARGVNMACVCETDGHVRTQDCAGVSEQHGGRKQKPEPRACPEPAAPSQFCLNKHMIHAHDTENGEKLERNLMFNYLTRGSLNSLQFTVKLQ